MFIFGTTPVRLLTENMQEVLHAHQDSLGKKSTQEYLSRQFRRFETEKLRDALERVLGGEEHPLHPCERWLTV